MRIIETDNFGSDWPAEKFIFEYRLSKEAAQTIADTLNNYLCPDGHYSRYWQVVEDDYQLQPGFEP
jgi:hypothetical protein